jgi:hypothetical protein
MKKEKLFSLMILIAISVSVNCMAVDFQRYNVFNIPVGATGVSSVSIGDLNRDGSNDIALGGAGGQIWRLTQTSTRGTFGSLAIDTYGQPIDIKVGDVSGDGYNDLVIARADGTLHREFSTGADTFSYSLINNNGAAMATAVGNLDQSGKNSILTLRSSDGTLALRQQNGSGGFGYTVLGAYGAASALAIGHMDATESPLVNDIIVGRDYGTLFIRFQGAAGNFSNQVSLGEYGQKITQVAVGDLNGDGKNDVLVVRQDGSVYERLQSGSENFSTQNLLLSLGQSVTAAAVGDLNNDGKADFVLGLANGNLLAEFQNADGTFTQQLLNSYSGATINSLSIGSLDSSGLNDLAVGLSAGGADVYYQTPEPATISLLALGCVTLVRRARK